MSEHVVVSGAFDDLRAVDIRFLHEASLLGPLHVALWTDELVRSLTGQSPKFPLVERQYLVESIRYVHSVEIVDEDSHLPKTAQVSSSLPASVPVPPPCPVQFQSARPRVVVTGCFDWLHSGHVRFFEEVAGLGDLYVIVGHDRNIRLLKGEGHPLIPGVARCYMVGSIRYVKAAMISSGHGWLDGEPEILKIRPDIYAVNEDGDHEDKRRFCESHGIEYRVLRRLPRAGLPRRQSTELRGF